MKVLVLAVIACQLCKSAVHSIKAHASLRDVSPGRSESYAKHFREQILDRFLQDGNGVVLDEVCSSALRVMDDWTEYNVLENHWYDSIDDDNEGLGCLLDYRSDGTGDDACVINYPRNAAFWDLTDFCRRKGLTTYTINLLKTCTGVPLANGGRITATYQVADYPLCLPPICRIEQYDEYYEEPSNSFATVHSTTECTMDFTYDLLGNDINSVARPPGPSIGSLFWDNSCRTRRE